MVFFDNIKNKQNIYLYAGDIDIKTKLVKPFIGLSLSKSDKHHIKHDVTLPMNLNDNSVDIYQCEDVFEHIEYQKLVSVFNEIYRVLKVGGLFRLSIPDYRCNILYQRTLKNNDGSIYHDPGGGGKYDNVNKKVINGGHVWFPKYESVLELFEKSNFNIDNVKFLHYYDENNIPHLNYIDYTKGHIHRTPDFDKRVQNPTCPMSIVVDSYK